MGERRKLPQRGPGRSSGRKRVLVHSELERTHVVTTNLVFLAGGRPTWRGVYSICYTHTFFKGVHPSHPPGSTPMLAPTTALTSQANITAVRSSYVIIIPSVICLSVCSPSSVCRAWRWCTLHCCCCCCCHAPVTVAGASDIITLWRLRDFAPLWMYVIITLSLYDSPCHTVYVSLCYCFICCRHSIFNCSIIHCYKYISMTTIAL